MSVEFHGEGIENMSIAERMTLCNMGIEFGAKNAVCKPDQKVLDAIKDNAKCDRWEPLWADEDAVYAAEYHYDLGDIEPGVAKPHKVDNYGPISEVKGTKIHEAFLGSCTNGRIEDLRAARRSLREESGSPYDSYPRLLDSLPPGDERGTSRHIPRFRMRHLQPGMRTLHGQPRRHPCSGRDSNQHSKP